MAQACPHIGQALECSVCLDYFNASKKRPRILTCCGHSFCVACIHVIRGDSDIKCPTCRQDTPLIDGNVDKLPTDFTALALIGSLCQVCRQAQWTSRCSECSLGTCASCLGNHTSEANQGISAKLKELQTKTLELENLCDDRFKAMTISSVENILKSEPGNNLGKIVAQIPDHMESLVKIVKQKCVEHTDRDTKPSTKDRRHNQNTVDSWDKQARELAKATTFFIRSTDPATRKCTRKLTGKESKKILAKCVVMSQRITELADQTPILQPQIFASESKNPSILVKSVDNVENQEVAEKTPTFSSYLSFVLQKYRAYQGPDIVPFVDASRHISTAVSPITGNIALIEHGAPRVTLLDSNLNLIRYIGSVHPGSSNGAFRHPFAVAFNGDGHLFVSDKNNHRIQVFLEGGKFLYKYGSRGSGAHQFMHPQGIAFDSRGFILICDSGNNRIQRMFVNNADWIRFTTFQVTYDEPKYIVVHDNRALVACEEGGYRFLIARTVPMFLQLIIPGTADACGLAVDRLNNVSAMDNTGKVIRVEEDFLGFISFHVGKFRYNVDLLTDVTFRPTTIICNSPFCYKQRYFSYKELIMFLVIVVLTMAGMVFTVLFFPEYVVDKLSTILAWREHLLRDKDKLANVIDTLLQQIGII